MAIDAGIYSLQQFKLAVKSETTLGTANTTSMQLVNISGWPSISRNTLNTTAVRHGDGRTLKKVDVYTTDKHQEKEISFTAIYDQGVGAILISNCTGQATGSSPSGFAITYNYTPPECNVGDTDTNNTGALTVALVSPEGNNTQIWPGCIVKSIRIYKLSPNNK